MRGARSRETPRMSAWESFFVGLAWVVPGVIVSFVLALLDAWVLLVEINR